MGGSPVRSTKCAVINAAVKALDKSFYSPEIKSQQHLVTLPLRTQLKETFPPPHSFSLSVIPPPPPLSSDSCHSLHTMDQDYYEGTDYLSPVPADGERAEEFEYEVGVRRRTGPLT